MPPRKRPAAASKAAAPKPQLHPILSRADVAAIKRNFIPLSQTVAKATAKHSAKAAAKTMKDELASVAEAVTSASSAKEVGSFAATQDCDFFESVNC